MDARAWAGFATERFGLAAAVLTVLAILAGLVLLPGYAAAPAAAHASVAAMAPWLRGVHAWAASLALVAMLLDLGRCWLGGPEPRHWYPRAAGLALLLGSVLGGGILAWDQQGWESLLHLRAGAGLAPAAPAAAPLGLLLAAHVALGALLLGLVALAWPRGGPALARDAARLALPLGILVAVLAILAPPALGPAPIEGLAVSKPDWPFLWLVPLQDALGPAALPLGIGAATVLLLAAPWLAARWDAPTRRQALLLAAGALLALSAWGLLA